jgi:hypothetical protein
VEAVRRMVNLSEVVVRSDLNVPKFLQRIKNDTTFYKAFRNLRVLSFTSLNDIRMLKKKGAPLPPAKQNAPARSGGCRTMEVLDEKTTGDMKRRRRLQLLHGTTVCRLVFYRRQSMRRNQYCKWCKPERAPEKRL